MNSIQDLNFPCSLFSIFLQYKISSKSLKWSLILNMQRDNNKPFTVQCYIRELFMSQTQHSQKTMASLAPKYYDAKCKWRACLNCVSVQWTRLYFPRDGQIDHIQTVKVKGQVILCLIKHHTMKTYKRIEV